MNSQNPQNFKLKRIVRYSYLLLVSVVGLMKPSIFVFSQKFILADFVFLLTAVLWVISLFFRQNKIIWHKFYFLLVFYLAAMLISSIFSINPAQSFIKLSGEIYLLGLAVLSFNLVRSNKDFKQVITAFLIGISVSVLIGLASIFLFYVQPENLFLEFTLFHYGAVPVGNYPRLGSSLVSASMFCNFLSVGLAILFAAKFLRWINKTLFYTFCAGILICSIFTISAGFGGIVLIIGCWYWIIFHNRQRFAAKFFLVGAVVFSILFLFFSVFALQPHSTAVYKIILPFLHTEIYPSSRILVWSDSFKTFQENLFVGKGLGQNVCGILFQNTEGGFSFLTDAHNVFLNVAGQNGIFGLIAICLIIFCVSRRFFIKNSASAIKTVLRLSLCLAFISAFFYQGLTGSFEDSRHLWIIFGLIFSTDKH